MLVCSELWCCLLPCAKVPAPGRRLDIAPDIVSHAAQPVLKTRRQSLWPVVADPSKLDSLIAVVLLDGWQFGSLDARRPQLGCWSQEAQRIRWLVPCRAGSSAVRFRVALAAPRLQGCDLASFLCQSLRFRWLLSVGMGPFYSMVRVHLARLVEHVLRMRTAMGSSPGGGFPCLARFGPQRFLAFLVRTAPVSLRSMVSPARGVSCLRFGLRFAYDKAGGKQADSLAWMCKRCSLPAGLPYSFGIALQVWYCCSIATC